MDGGRRAISAQNTLPPLIKPDYGNREKGVCVCERERGGEIFTKCPIFFALYQTELCRYFGCFAGVFEWASLAYILEEMI